MPKYSKYPIKDDPKYFGPVYLGLLDPDIMAPAQRQAYRIYRTMVNRCYCKTSVSYKYYGARGIEVRFSVRQFIGWWVRELRKFSGTQPTTGRIRHSGNYSFKNIRMQDNSANTKEMIERCGTPTVPRAVLILQAATGKRLARCRSLHAAERRTGICYQNIYKYCRQLDGYSQTRGGLTFRYAD